MKDEKTFDIGFSLTLEEFELVLKALDVYYAVAGAFEGEKWKSQWETVYNLQLALSSRLTELQAIDPFADDGKPIDIADEDIPF